MLRKKEAILVALLVTAFWVAIFVLTSNASIPYEVCEPKKEGPKQAAKECARYNIISFALREIGAHLDIVSALITAVATAFIARYTFTLKRSTDRLWEVSKEQIKGSRKIAALQARQTRESIREARRSADVAENALTKLERPYIFIFSVSSLRIEDVSDAGGDYTLLRVSFSIANHGKIPAIVTMVRLGLSVFDEPLAPPLVDFPHPLSVSPIFAAGETRTGIEPDSLLWEGDMEYDGDSARSPALKESSLWFWAVITYRGPFGGDYETSICLRYDPRTGRFFEAASTEEYNYQK